MAARRREDDEPGEDFLDQRRGLGRLNGQTRWVVGAFGVLLMAAAIYAASSVAADAKAAKDLAVLNRQTIAVNREHTDGNYIEIIRRLDDLKRQIAEKK